ncbi:glutathione S-transferase family protein, partial [Sulfitobacter sp.]|uniref:glutathione S-transferase family protein n=1 Tax=Sulfitobacter sp. TaxID=1903071 RepID=UPI003EF8BEF9
MLLESDIQTKEVLSWKGLHLFHFAGSSCSQKTRIFLRLKGIEWTSHHVNLIAKEHLKPHFMGINPRGLVPVLVHDGKVIIESNDILEYLEAEFPEPALIPADKAGQVHELLKQEDDLHMDIRALTMRFVFPSFLTKRPSSDIEAYENSGSGTVGGEVDSHREAEIKFWRDMAAHGKISDTQSASAFQNFKAVLNEFDQTLSKHEYLVGDDVTLVDIAWYIYARRLGAAGYPLQRLHPHVGRWFDRLHANPNFSEEVPSGGVTSMITKLLH